MSGGQLSGGQLSSGQLSGVNCRGVNCRGSIVGGQLSGGQLSGGQLSGGQLSGGQLSGVQLSGVNCRGVNCHPPISDMAGLVAKHIDLHYPDFFAPYNSDTVFTEDIKKGLSKVQFDFVSPKSTFDPTIYNREEDPHPMSGHISRLSLYDRLHESNQRDR